MQRRNGGALGLFLFRMRRAVRGIAVVLASLTMAAAFAGTANTEVVDYPPSKPRAAKVAPIAIETRALPGPSGPVTHPSEIERESSAMTNASGPLRVVTIVLVGDTGFSGSGLRADGSSAVRHGIHTPFHEFTAGIAPLIDGDINFANLETVVTDDRSLVALDKAFVFQSHPAAVHHLTSLGFNLFSLANNHAIDYGRRGMRETLRHMAALPTSSALAVAGIGKNKIDALTPRPFSIGSDAFAFTAVGIGTGGRPNLRPSANQPGQLAWANMSSSTELMVRLGALPDTYSILSVHTGIERQLRPTSRDRRLMRDHAVRKHGVDLVVGHHAHVVQGIERVDDKLIFYGLGNFMHVGMQNMARFGVCRDFGLLAKVHLAARGSAPLKPAAIEVIPLTDMHQGPRRLSGAAGKRRVSVLNGLAAGLDDTSAGSEGIRFHALEDGRGLHCDDLGGDLPGEIGTACQRLGHATPLNTQSRACGAHTPSITARRRSGGSRATSQASPRKRRASKVVSRNSTWQRRSLFPDR